MGLSVRTKRWIVTCALLLTVAGAGILVAARGAATRGTVVKSSPTTTQVRSLRGLTEAGILDGAAYRIDIPAQWNHKLVIYFHGYSQHLNSFHPQERLSGEQAPLFDRHYAVAQSAYSQAGWALPQAFPETEALREYFVRRFGHPIETYAAGRSMGGALVAITLELNPEPYTGGLDLCGAVGPSQIEFDRRFAQRAAFDLFFPELMPPLVPGPGHYEANRAERERIAAALKRNPQGASAMRALIGLRNDAELASDMAYFTFVMAEMQRRAGANPFDNSHFVYEGLAPRATTAFLNQHVRRYSAQPAARAYLLRHYTPTGRLGRPMLAVHTSYDPVVPVSQLAGYAAKVEAAGYASNLVQEYVPRDGHCNVTPEQAGRAFDELVRWTHGGPKPPPGLIQEPVRSPAFPQETLNSVLPARILSR